MKQSPIPPDEEKRLEALRALSLLDTPAEARFERITDMVCRLLDVPIAAVSLVDESRQWMKSVKGGIVREMPRDLAFCPHAILGEQTLIVPNAHDDPRFSQNPLVLGEPRIVFYAGEPIRSPDGLKVGTLCAIDRKARTLTAEQVEVLKHLAALVEIELQALIPAKIEEGLKRELGAGEEGH